MWTTLAAGFGTGLGLIVAVGAQNAFLLRQAIRGEHVLPVVLTCLVSDVVAVTAGVGGLGAVLRSWPGALQVAQLVGGIYLLFFGVHAAFRAWRPQGLEAGPGGAGRGLLATLLATLVLTWLNPHFYLDTVLMLGTVANSFGAAKWWFALGSIGASAIWFFSVGYGARLLRGFFARPASWRVLDGVVALMMGTLGVGLLVH